MYYLCRYRYKHTVAELKCGQYSYSQCYTTDNTYDKRIGCLDATACNYNETFVISSGSCLQNDACNGRFRPGWCHGS